MECILRYTYMNSIRYLATVDVFAVVVMKDSHSRGMSYLLFVQLNRDFLKVDYITF